MSDHGIYTETKTDTWVLCKDYPVVKPITITLKADSQINKNTTVELSVQERGAAYIATLTDKATGKPKFVVPFPKNLRRREVDDFINAFISE